MAVRCLPMNSTISVYMAGPVEEVGLDNARHWRSCFKSMLDPHICAVSPIRGYESFVFASKPHGNDRLCMLRDKLDIRRSDIVVANFMPVSENAQEREIMARGTCIEIGWADAWEIPVIVVCNKAGSIASHPMLSTIPFAVCESLETAASMVNTLFAR